MKSVQPHPIQRKLLHTSHVQTITKNLELVNQQFLSYEKAITTHSFWLLILFSPGITATWFELMRVSVIMIVIGQ